MADVFGVRVTAELSILDSLIIICNNAGGQVEPTVTFADQQYFVAWLDPAFDQRTPDVKVARVDLQGAVLDAGIPVGTGDYSPGIAFDGNRCLVTWCAEYTGVLGRFVNASCQPEGNLIEIATTMGSSTTPTAEYGTGAYLVVWPDFCPLGTDLDIYGQMVSMNGQLMGERIHIADGTASQSQPALRFDGNTFLVVWVEDLNLVYGRYFSPDGVPLGAKFPVSENTSFERQHPSLAAGTENYLIAWNEYHTDFDVYGNLDASVGIEETGEEVPVRTMTLLAHHLNTYLDGESQLYDVAGRRVQHTPIAPGIYFLKRSNEELLKIVVVR
jgi:hypothetical protein